MGSAASYVNAFAHLVGYLEEYCQTTDIVTRQGLRELLSDPERLQTYEEYRLSHPHEPLPKLPAEELIQLNAAIGWIDQHRNDRSFLDHLYGSSGETGAQVLLFWINCLTAHLRSLPVTVIPAAEEQPQ